MTVEQAGELVPLSELNARLGILLPPIGEWLAREGHGSRVVEDKVSGEPAVPRSLAERLIEEAEERRRQRRADAAAYEKYLKEREAAARAKRREERAKADEKAKAQGEKWEAARRADVERRRKETEAAHLDQQKKLRQLAGNPMPFEEWRKRRPTGE